jgi:hypothetical protein
VVFVASMTLLDAVNHPEKISFLKCIGCTKLLRDRQQVSISAIPHDEIRRISFEVLVPDLDGLRVAPEFTQDSNPRRLTSEPEK